MLYSYSTYEHSRVRKVLIPLPPVLGKACLAHPLFFLPLLLTGIVLEAQGGARELYRRGCIVQALQKGQLFLMNKYRVHSITSRQLLS